MTLSKKHIIYWLATAGIVAILINAQAAPAVAEGTDRAEDIRLLAGSMPQLLGGVPIAAASPPEKPASATLVTLYEHHLPRAPDVTAEMDHGQPDGIDPVHTSAIVPGVFGSVAIPMRNFPISERWAKVFDEIRRCGSTGDCEDDFGSLSALIGPAKDARFLTKLDEINRGVNRMIKYRKDQTVYGDADHWATPTESLQRGAGDCEDFAILKMTALLRAGIPSKSMSLVVLRSLKHRAFHAVLAVSTSNGAFILDNLTDEVLSDADITDYVPLYSLSTDRAWIHGSRSGGSQLADLGGSFASILPGEGGDLSIAVGADIAP